jgi:Rnl2 family RNA ligase
MSAFPKYPELVLLNKRPEILAVKEVIATEKLHGTNFRVFFPAEMTSIADVQFGGRNEEFGTDDGGKFYSGRPVQWFKSQPELLEKMWSIFKERGYSDVVVYGEVCGAGIQKGVRYVTDREILFRAFDVRIGENFVTHNLFVEICDAVGLPRVPEVWRGEPSLAAFDALLEQPSLEGQRNGVSDERNLMEGVVIRSNPLLRNVLGEWLIIKHKSEKFAEVAKASDKQRADLTPVEIFARTYVVRGHIINSLGRLRDAGAPLVNGMEDMPRLVPAMMADLHKECVEELQVLVTQGFSEKQIRSAVSKMLAVVYRRMLLEEVGG